METTFRGVGVSHGVVIGTVRHMGTAVLQPPDRRSPAEAVPGEQGRARRAVDAVAADLTACGDLAGSEAQAVLEAQALMAQDPELMAEVERRVAGGGCAERTVFDAFAAYRALLANNGGPADVPAALTAGAEGVGLFRTEFLFLDDNRQAPSEDRQVEAYRQVFEAFPEARVVVRVLDTGADKPLGFLTPAHEPNPALGVRGLRTLRHHPDVLSRQQSDPHQGSRPGTRAAAPLGVFGRTARGHSPQCNRLR